MRILVSFLALTLAACAARPAPEPVQPATPAPAAAADRHDHRTLNGMTAGELIQHFGKPRLQIREGDGTKLQFSGPSCVLDVYLYPSGGTGAPRATHIEARNAQGVDVNTQTCATSIEGR